MFIYVRWKLEHGGDIGINCHMWNYPLNPWRTASFDFGSCRTDHYNVHVFVQLCQITTQLGPRALFSLDCMVRKKKMCIHSYVDHIVHL